MNTKYYKDLWDYYTQNNYVFVKKGESYREYIECFKKEDKEKYKEHHFKFLNSYPEFEDFIRKTNYKFVSIISEESIKNKNNIASDFFIQHYKKSDLNDKKELLKNWNLVYPTLFNNSLHLMLKETTSSIKDTQWLLDNMPSKYFKYYLKLNDIDTHLVSQFKEEDNYNFWISFFKKRKHHLNKPHESNTIKKFLKKKYSKEQLSAFFPFFPLLKADYEDINISLFSENYQQSFNLTIQTSHLFKKFAISYWDINIYEDTLFNLGQSIQKNHSCEILSQLINGDLSITFLFNDNLFNKEQIKETIITLFTDLKNNGVIDLPTKEYIDTWYQSHLLKQQLPEKTDIKERKLKI